MARKIFRVFKRFKDTLLKHLINIKNIFRFAIFQNRYGVYSGAKRDEQIVVSLTSFPARMDKIHLCIQSLLLQNVKPDKIVLYLGDKEFENVELPEKLTRLKQYGLEIKFCKDLKPHTKYFYSMQEFSGACIITVDDDVYYSKNLVRDLLKEHENRPKEVICTRAHKMAIKDNQILPYSEWDYETKDIERSSDLLMATGVGGVLYPPNCLPAQAFDEKKIIELCLKADDVWLKAMEILAGTKVHAIPSSKTKYVVGIWGSEKVALFKSNVGRNQNDIYIRQVFEHYDITASRIIKE